jgi:hypothetical protein
VLCDSSGAMLALKQVWTKLPHLNPSLTALFVHSQLDVKGCPSIYMSFNQYTRTEVLDGVNQYRAQGYGLQVDQ